MEGLEVEGRTAVDVDFDFEDSFEVDAEAVGVVGAAGFVPDIEDSTPHPTPSAERAACPCEAIPMYFSAVFFCVQKVNTI